MFGLSSRMLSERSSYSAGDTGWASLNSALSIHMQKKKPQMTATVFSFAAVHYSAKHNAAVTMHEHCYTCFTR